LVTDVYGTGISIHNPPGLGKYVLHENVKVFDLIELGAQCSQYL
jgi:hypothetical protein